MLANFRRNLEQAWGQVEIFYIWGYNWVLCFHPFLWAQVIFICNFKFKTASHSLPLAFFLNLFKENKIVTAAISLHMDDINLTKKTSSDFSWVSKLSWATKLTFVNSILERTTFFKISLSTCPQRQVFACTSCQGQLRRRTMNKRKQKWSRLSSCSRIWAL